MKRNFTLTEIMITAVVILVVATLALGGYQQALENARQRVCATNLKALGSAVQMWALESDFLPATLGQLKEEQLEKAYAQVMREGGWLTEFSYALIKFDASRDAYAQFLTPENLAKFGVSADIFHCPSDHTPPPQGVSYGINNMLPSRTVNGQQRIYWEDIGESELIVADCDEYTFSGYSNIGRHSRGFLQRKREFSLGITKGLKVVSSLDDEYYSGGGSGGIDDEVNGGGIPGAGFGADGSGSLDQPNVQEGADDISQNAPGIMDRVRDFTDGARDFLSGLTSSSRDSASHSERLGSDHSGTRSRGPGCTR